MLPESTIDRVVGGLRMCHRELAIDGTAVILDDLATANKPGDPPSTRRSSQPRVPSHPRSSSSALRSLMAEAGHPPSWPFQPQASPSQPRFTSPSHVSQAFSEPGLSHPQAAASSPSPPLPTPSPPSSQPDVVALDLEAAGPWFGYPLPIFKPLLRGKEPWKNRSDFDYVHVDPSQVVTKIDGGDGHGKGQPAADLVLWHVNNRVLELKADMDFTENGAMNALAREVALNTAKKMLLQYADERFRSDKDGYAPDDPAVVQFLARFRANLIALVVEATSAPAAFSVSHPRLPDDVEGRLREKAARNRRKDADMKEHQRLWKEYEAAVEARSKKSEAAAGEGTAASPDSAGDIPEKPKPRYCSAEPILPDPLAASPPPLVLRPIEDLYRVFTVAEIMDVFNKVILSRNDCVLCPGYEIWFEKKRAVKKDGVVRHEYAFKTGEPYC